MRVGAFLAAGGDVEPIGASSLFLSDFSAPKGAFSREGAFSSVGFFLFAFFGFLSSSFLTSSFSFCFAVDEFLRSLAFFLRCSCVDESVVRHAIAATRVLSRKAGRAVSDAAAAPRTAFCNIRRRGGPRSIPPKKN